MNVPWPTTYKLAQLRSSEPAFYNENKSKNNTASCVYLIYQKWSRRHTGTISIDTLKVAVKDWTFAGCPRTNLSKYGHCRLHFATKTKYLTTEQVGITRYDAYDNTTPNRPSLECFTDQVVCTEVHLRRTSRFDPNPTTTKGTYKCKTLYKNACLRAINHIYPSTNKIYRKPCLETVFHWHRSKTLQNHDLADTVWQFFLVFKWKTRRRVFHFKRFGSFPLLHPLNL